MTSRFSISSEAHLKFYFTHQKNVNGENKNHSPSTLEVKLNKDTVYTDNDCPLSCRFSHLQTLKIGVKNQTFKHTFEVELEKIQNAWENYCKKKSDAPSTYKPTIIFSAVVHTTRREDSMSHDFERPRIVEQVDDVVFTVADVIKGDYPTVQSLSAIDDIKGFFSTYCAHVSAFLRR